MGIKPSVQIAIPSSFCCILPIKNATSFWNSVAINFYVTQSRRLARQQSQIRELLIWSKIAGCSYTASLNKNIFYKPFSFMLLWVVGSERLHSKASMLKTMKASKDQKEMAALKLKGSKRTLMSESCFRNVTL